MRDQGRRTLLGGRADHLVTIAGGTFCAAGEPSHVLTVETVRQVFGLDSVITTDPVSGSPLMVPIGRHHSAASAEHSAP